MNAKKLPQNESRLDVYYGRKSTGYKSDDQEEEQNQKYGHDKQARSLPKQKRAFEEIYEALPAEEKTHKLITIEEAQTGYRPGKRDGYKEC